MKFSIGYQLAEAGEESFVRVVEDYRDHIAEVYFSWADQPTGRARLLSRRGWVDWTGQRRLEEELRALRDLGVELNLLLNANCYGGAGLSEHLANQVLSTMDHLGGICDGVDRVTTASPTIARVVHEHAPDVDVRASVNMRIGTMRGLEYVADLFDSFCVQREYNRNLEHLAALKRWADDRGKGLTMLANSGCLAYCSAQTFHDNLVAHECEVDEMRNVSGASPHICWNYLHDRRNWPALLKNTWVRPEDLYRHEGLFGVVKLATRMHSRPRMVIDAYARGRHRGNLLDLFEPAYGPILAPYIIDNERIPEDFFEKTASCAGRCDSCDYCEQVLEAALVRMDEAGLPAQI